MCHASIQYSRAEVKNLSSIKDWLWKSHWGTQHSQADGGEKRWNSGLPVFTFLCPRARNRIWQREPETSPKQTLLQKLQELYLVVSHLLGWKSEKAAKERRTRAPEPYLSPIALTSLKVSRVGKYSQWN